MEQMQMTKLEWDDMMAVIEGLLFVSGNEGIDLEQLSIVLEEDKGVVERCLLHLKERYEQEKRGLQIIELAGSYQMTTRAEHAGYFQRLAYTPTRGTLSQAALETLAIIAYKQPITRIDIEEIRGVNSDRALQTLIAKQLVKPVGRAEVIGRPILYGTTEAFMDYFGLRSLQDLPDPSYFQTDAPLDEATQQWFEKLTEEQQSSDQPLPIEKKSNEQPLEDHSPESEND